MKIVDVEQNVMPSDFLNDIKFQILDDIGSKILNNIDLKYWTTLGPKY